MPLGAVTALMGLRGCMTILHGSQGCATYIRRHMATHYNEPIDIASSSLTEQGTVFGGEMNLLMGLKNLIKLYRPEVIGVCTTCLAETIGEDTEMVVKRFYEQNPEETVKIITVASAGYGGTQYEGYFRSLRAVVEQTPPDCTSNGKINIITPVLSPADTRWLKAFLLSLNIDYILLPDLSDNLDGVTVTKYERLKTSGTALEEVSKMAGAKLTIEFSEFVNYKDSPGEFLQSKYKVPLIRLPLPTGICAMDRLISVLRDNGAEIPEELRLERGRYLDAMVDSHKYCAKAKAAIFGEPDFVKSMVSLCCENGIVPLLVTTGSVCPALKASIEDEIQAQADLFFDETPVILDDCDFETIGMYSKKLGINLMIGNSDGRRVADDLEVELIRCAFPIHDRVGGQRVRTIGFDGSLAILDGAANAMLALTKKHFRKGAYQKYYLKTGG
jgi:nitrogenase molybdenum-iron protein alpha/beta subunit